MVVRVRDTEPLLAAVVVAKPEPVFLDELEDFAVGDGVLVAEDEELLAVLDELADVLAEERERRVGDDDVGLVQQRDAFGGAEVAVTGQEGEDVAFVLFNRYSTSDRSMAPSLLASGTSVISTR